MRTSLYILALALLGLSSCETVVDIDLPDEPSKLVVNSYFSSDSLWEVQVSASKSILAKGDLPLISNADVTIRQADGTTFQLEAVAGEPGIYRSDMRFPESLEEYEIIVSASGYRTVKGASSTPSAVPIHSIDTASTIAFGFPQTEIRVNFTDPGNERNYYAVKLYFEVRFIDGGGDTIAFRQDLPFAYANDDLFSGSGTLIEDTPFNGKRFTLNLIVQDDGFGQPTDSIGGGPGDDFIEDLVVELKSVSEEYFLYESSIFNYRISSGDPFSQPAQVYNNIDNGFGVFAGFSASKMRVGP